MNNTYLSQVELIGFEHIEIQGTYVVGSFKTYIFKIYNINMDYFRHIIILSSFIHIQLGKLQRGTNHPTKMCIKSAPLLNQKSANWALKFVFFWCFGAE